MLTDLHLRKYLDGRLSRQEEQDLEALLEKNPALKQRLQELEARDNTVLRPRWERVFLDRKSRQGSRVRYTTILPALVLLLFILALTSHWFGKPGSNSTFLQAGGNGTAVDLLYNSNSGWRYLDAGFRPGDSLTIIVREAGRYAVRVFAVYAGLPDAVAVELWSSAKGRRFAQGDLKPIFSSQPPSTPRTIPPRYLAVIYDTGSVAELAAEEIVGLLREGSGGGREPAFQYQVFRVPEPDTTR